MLKDELEVSVVSPLVLLNLHTILSDVLYAANSISIRLLKQILTSHKPYTHLPFVRLAIVLDHLECLRIFISYGDGFNFEYLTTFAILKAEKQCLASENVSKMEGNYRG